MSGNKSYTVGPQRNKAYITKLVMCLYKLETNSEEVKLVPDFYLEVKWHLVKSSQPQFLACVDVI